MASRLRTGLAVLSLIVAVCVESIAVRGQPPRPVAGRAEARWRQGQPAFAPSALRRGSLRQKSERRLVLDHARVIDGTGEAAQNDMRVTIRADRIESVQPSGKGVGT